MIIYLSISLTEKRAILGERNNNYDKPQNWIAIGGMTELSRQLKERSKAIEQIGNLFSYLSQYKNSPITKAINSFLDTEIKRSIKQLRNKISYTLSCNYYSATIITNFLHPTTES